MSDFFFESHKNPKIKTLLVAERNYIGFSCGPVSSPVPTLPPVPSQAPSEALVERAKALEQAERANKRPKRAFEMSR